MALEELKLKTLKMSKPLRGIPRDIRCRKTFRLELAMKSREYYDRIGAVKL